LVKRVAAYAGDEICAQDRQIYRNGRLAAERRAADGQRRPMPTWKGCVRLRSRQLFLLTDDPVSFDGRYFGVTEGKDIIGRATLLWRP
jgi:type IV secretory pathway protease TraF